MQLPVPMMNVINGGAHADNSLDLQEFMIVPVGAPSFREALRCGAEIFHALKKLLNGQGHVHHGRRRRRLRAEPAQQRGRAQAHHGGDRGGRLRGRRARSRSRSIAPARSSSRTAQYRSRPRACKLSAAQFTDYLAAWVDKYPIISIEDGMAEDDWDGWKLLTERLGDSGAAGGRRSVRDQHRILARGHPPRASPTRS